MARLLTAHASSHITSKYTAGIEKQSHRLLSRSSLKTGLSCLRLFYVPIHSLFNSDCYFSTSRPTKVADDILLLFVIINTLFNL